MAETNIESYFVSDLPGVFINKVTLDIAGEKAQGTPFNKDPHIVQNLTDFDLVDSSSAENETLKVQIDFNIKIKMRFDRAAEDLLSTWVFNKYFLDYYKIAVILVNNSEMYELLVNSLSAEELTKEGIGELLFTTSNHPNAKSKVLSLGGDNGIFNLTSEEDISDYLSSLSSVIDGNHYVYDIPFSHKSEYNETYPSHLSAFVVPYLDVEQVKIDYDLEDLDIDYIFGQPITEVVIHDGETSTQRRVFHEQPTADEINNFIPTPENPTVKGKIYAGPAHQMPDGGWMKGAYHGQTDDAPLVVSQIRNNIVHDMRIAKIFEKIPFDYSVIENSKLGINSPKLSALINDNLDVVREPSYISALSTSRDHLGRCRFFFSVDYLTMIKKNSVFKILFEQSNPSQIEDLLKGSIIRHFSFFRKRVKGKRGSGLINKLGSPNGPIDFDSNKSVDVLITSGDQVRNQSSTFGGGTHLLSKNNERDYNTHNDEGEQDPDLPKLQIAYLREVDLLTAPGTGRSNYPYMRHFTGVDSEVATMTDGFYQYGVEIEIEDPTVNYMEKRLEALSDLIAIYEQYYSLASGVNKSQIAISNFGEEPRGGRKKQNFETTSQRYVPEFIDELSKYGEEGSDMRRFVHDIEFVGEDITIKNHINQYISILQLMTNGQVSNNDRDKFVEGLAKVLNPVTGTPTGISVFLKLLNDLGRNMQRLLDSAISGPVKKPAKNIDESPQAPLARFKVDATRTFRISKHFSDPEEIFDAEIPKSLGADYITSFMLPEEKTVGENRGLISINTADYLERVLVETAKYFNPTKDLHLPENLVGFPGGMDMPLTPYKYSHFSPSQIQVRKGKRFDVLQAAIQQNNNFYNVDIYNEILMDVLRYNSGLDITFPPYNIKSSSPSSLALTKQRNRASLIDFMASKSCTVDNMISFSAPIENDVIIDHCKDVNEAKKTVDAEEGSDITDFLKSVVSNTSKDGLDAMSWDSTNPINVLSPLIRTFTGGISRKATRRKFDMYDAGPFITLMTKLILEPNQIKALYGMVSFGPRPETWPTVDMLTNMSRLGKVFNKDYFGFIYINNLDLARVEILSGYQVNNSSGQNEAQMKNPIFNLMTEEQWNELSDFSTPNQLFTRALCRLRKSSSSHQFAIRNLDIPMYNQYFFLRRATSIAGKPASEFGIDLTTPYDKSLNGETVAPPPPAGETVPPPPPGSDTQPTTNMTAEEGATDQGEAEQTTGTAAGDITTTQIGDAAGQGTPTGGVPGAETTLSPAGGIPGPSGPAGY